MLTLIFILYASWTTEVVTTVTNLDEPTISIDASGNPYILVNKDRIFVPPTLHYLFVFLKSNGSWIADTIELNALDPYYADLTTDIHNQLVCIYPAYDQTDTTWYLIAAFEDTTEWLKDTIELSYGSDFYWHSIITDSSGTPHIAYDHSVSGVPYGFYTWLEDSIWHKEVVDTLATWAYCCAIDLDSLGRAHISYFRGGDNLWYAKETDSVWYLEEVDHTNFASWWITSIRIGPDDLPKIVYRDPNTYQIKYAYNNGTFWNIDTVESQGAIVAQKALDIDSFGRPYFIYGSNNNTYLAYKTTTEWYKEILPLPPSVTKGYGGALRIGPDGTIHIARLATNDDYSYREVHYIYGTPIGIEETNHKPAYNYRNPILEIYPNPFREKTTIHLYTEQTTRKKTKGVELRIYDVTGRLIRQFDNLTTVQSQKIIWDGTDYLNKKLRPGIYFCRLETDDCAVARKIIKLR
jgi:hypothetical protein